MLSISDYHQFALQVSFGLGAGFLVVIWSALHSRGNVRQWLDITLAALITGLIGARLLYVLLHWPEFADYPQDMLFKFWAGGLIWQGALLGLVGGWLVARWRGVSFARWGDSLALALPLLMLAVWWACRGRGWGYGIDLENPTWLTGYLPNEQGDIARRLELQIFGIWSGLILLVFATQLTINNSLAGQRLWLILGLLGLSQLLLGLGRGNEWQPLLDGLVLSVGLLGFIISFRRRRRVNLRIV